MPPCISILISRGSRWWLFAIIRWILAMCEAEQTVEEGSTTFWGGWMCIHCPGVMLSTLIVNNCVIFMLSILTKTSHREKE